MKPAQRLDPVPAYPYVAWSRRCREAAARDLEVIRLDIGDPDLPPPASVVDRLREAVACPSRHGYPGYRGAPELRTAFAGYVARRFDVEVDPETQVLPLLGAKEGIVHLALASAGPGDVVLVPDPGYAPYAIGALLAGSTIERLPLATERGALPDLGAVSEDMARRARLLWLNYPNNPTGATAGLGFLAEAVAFARRHRILLCHDAAYVDIGLDGERPPSVLQIPGATEVAIEFHSLSKTYNMAGWRLGMAVGRADAVGLLARIKSNIDSGIFLCLQDAATEALVVKREWIDRRNDVYRRRLEVLRGALSGIGWTSAPPRATPYLWVRIPGETSAQAAADEMLDTVGIAVAPGTFFGPGGEGYVRVSATCPTDQVEEAACRLRQWTPRWSGRRTG